MDTEEEMIRKYFGFTELEARDFISVAKINGSYNKILEFIK